ncbi:MAG TPA: nitroreductase/quinone reductase family protein, partial [Roseiflexaceae bacterium]|nr:nitroreductase/quinone reductase family protein [Roseiflexaceae bacterium]
MTLPERARWQRALDWIPSTRLGADFFAYTLYHVDRPLLRLSNGRLSIPALISGLPVVSLTTTGAKSGQQHTTPLLGIPDGENIVLIASYYGRPRHPAWYYNVRANPRVHLALPGRAGWYMAEEASGAERERYWQQAVALYSGFAAYRRLAGART